MRVCCRRHSRANKHQLSAHNSLQIILIWQICHRLADSPEYDSEDGEILAKSFQLNTIWNQIQLRSRMLFLDLTLLLLNPEKNSVYLGWFGLSVTAHNSGDRISLWCWRWCSASEKRDKMMNSPSPISHWYWSLYIYPHWPPVSV